MARRMKASAYLENVTSIPMECSDVENDELYDSEGDFLENQSHRHGRDDNSSIIIESSDNESDQENIPNRRTRRRRRFPSSCEDEGEIQDQTTEIASDGTIWKQIEEGGAAGRLPIQCIFKDVPGPTGHAKRNIMKGELSSAFSLLIDHNILEHIRICTETEASRVLGKKWVLTEAKLKAFIAILYARGAYEANTLRLEYLWNMKWGPKCFSATMSRKTFCSV